MSNPDNFDLREWLVPPLVVPLFLILLVAVAAIL